MRKLLHLLQRKEKGFTLIEVLLATTISLIGLSAGVIVLALGYKHFNLGRHVAQEQKARIALEKMVRELQETGIFTINPDSSVIYSEENSSSIISFASARHDETNEFLTDQNGMPSWINAIVYFRDATSNTLYRYKEPKTYWGTNYDVSGFDPSLTEGSEPMAQFITDLKFWFSDDELLNIKMKIALASEEEESPYELTLNTTIKIRN